MIAYKDLLIPIAMLLTVCSTLRTEEDSRYGASVGIDNHTDVSP